MKKINLMLASTAVFSILSGSFCTVNATEDSDDQQNTKMQVPESGVKKQAYEFVMQVGNEIISILAEKSRPLNERKSSFKTVLLKYFDMPAIGKFVIGQYWRALNDSQKSEYIKLFEQAVVENYAAKFNNYNNQKLEVKSVTNEPNAKQFRVYSNIVQPSGKIFHKIEWIIEQTANGFRVLDLRIEGISMRLTMRTDYKGVYARGGYPELKNYLNNKIDNASDQPADSSSSDDE